jgi:rod shape-determining protein MreC
MNDDPARTRTVVALLTLTAVALLTLDSQERSPVDPLRDVVASVVGPVEDAAATAVRPVTGIGDYFGDVDRLRDDNERLAADNAELTRELNAAEANSARAAEVEGIGAFADASGFDVVAAQVVAIGSAQSFSRTVTIDRGTRDGVSPDLTVINADGLVGRVIEAGPSTATVLLIIDAKSSIGGRLGASMELGFLDGSGDISDDGTLELSLVDHTISPRRGDPVLTWGSRNGAPYVAGVPVGEVVSVHSSPAELTQTAEIRPYVDFSALDVVAVVTGASGAESDLADGGSR